MKYLYEGEMHEFHPPSGVKLNWVEHGWGELEQDGRRIPFAAHRDGDKVQVWVEGRVYQIELCEGPRRSTGSSAAGGGNQVKAAMPGTVLAVRVAPGAAVKAGQPLLLLESMKMEMNVESPRDGRVKAVACQAGQLVEMGAVLVELEPDAAAPR